MIEIKNVIKWEKSIIIPVNDDICYYHKYYHILYIIFIFILSAGQRNTILNKKKTYFITKFIAILFFQNIAYICLKWIRIECICVFNCRYYCLVCDWSTNHYHMILYRNQVNIFIKVMQSCSNEVIFDAITDYCSRNAYYCISKWSNLSNLSQKLIIYPITINSKSDILWK